MEKLVKTRQVRNGFSGGIKGLDENNEAVNYNGKPVKCKIFVRIQVIQRDFFDRINRIFRNELPRSRAARYQKEFSFNPNAEH